MTKTEIFDDIVSVVKHDAAFCKDIPGADVEIYRSKINDDMPEDEFVFNVQSYLASFGVQGHLAFRSKRGFISFQVKRWQDALYVVATAKNSPLCLGDKITHVDGLTVREYGERHTDMLYGECEARQGDAWLTLLSYAKTVTVERNDEYFNTAITLDGDWSGAQARYTCKQLADNIAYMRLKDFNDDAAINELYRANDALLRSSEYLIIDVRGNEGGNDSAYMPLYEFCMPEGTVYEDLPAGPYEEGMEINYSARNCDQRIRQFEKMLAQDIPTDTRNMLTRFVDEMKANRGKGFVAFSSGENTTEEGGSCLPYVGAALPKKVYIITDEACASSGDAFVADMSRCGKVMVVGRPTMGILDYSNCAGAFYDDDYVLIYPTSRSLYLDKGVQMRQHGVPVDVHIPWTPEHIQHDTDLQTVLDMIKAK